MNIDFARCEFGQEERDAVNRVMSGHWLASGKENEAFEKEFAEYVGTKYAVCVNSGSSANLLALCALDLPQNASVISSACGFPATLSPIIHCGLKPVLVDYNLDTHNISTTQVIENFNKVSAVIFAHTMGNPVSLEIIEKARELGIPVIEDCCEAVGSEYPLLGKVGRLGTLGTFSFYPAHQMTALGGGGMIVTDNRDLALKCKSLRDWGKIWNWDMTLGDTKTTYTGDYYPGYTYSSVGYNMKLPEANAAFGREQLKRLPGFVKRREENHAYLAEKLKDLDCFVDIKADAPRISWFGYILTFKDGEKYDRNSFGHYLESCGIRHRPFFAGNITKHKPFSFLGGHYPVADKLMRDSLFIGCWPGMTQEMLDYISEKIHAYCSDSQLQRQRHAA